MKTIGCAYGIRGRQELEDEGAEFIVDTPIAIADIILASASKESATTCCIS